MLSVKHANLAIKILALILAASISFFFATSWISETDFMKESFDSVAKNKQTVSSLSLAMISTSLAISALPDDFATPLADSIADMNIYFIAISLVLFFEEILLQYGVLVAFRVLIPIACVVGIIAVLSRKTVMRNTAIRFCALALAVAFVVPCSAHITNCISSEGTTLSMYVEDTIAETESGADKLNTAMRDTAEDQNIFEKLSDLLQTAINDIFSLLEYYKNNFTRCMNSIAILVLTNCIMPIITFLAFKWIMGEILHIAIPTPNLKRYSHKKHEKESVSESIETEN